MSCIKGVQRGTGEGNTTIPINPVDLNKSVVLIWGSPIATLTSDTTIGITNGVGPGTDKYGHNIAVNLPYAWQVIEFA